MSNEAKDTMKYLRILNASEEGKTISIVYRRPRFYIGFSRSQNTRPKEARDSSYYCFDNCQVKGSIYDFTMTIKPIALTKAYVKVDPAYTKIHIPRWFRLAFGNQFKKGHKQYHSWLEYLETRKKFYTSHLILVGDKE